MTEADDQAHDPPVPNPPVVVIDERGRTCPHPVIALGRASKVAPPGSRIDLLADDPAAESDVPAWCRMTGADFLGAELLGAGVGTAPRRYRVRTRQSVAPVARA
ncbi:MAG: tRNA 2-thiouridine synthesizing protein [Actinomycetota bacterium]|nr:tRNA 2-thiouridine synthesizing protein [Actinomycetota bacterium]